MTSPSADTTSFLSLHDIAIQVPSPGPFCVHHARERRRVRAGPAPGSAFALPRPSAKASAYGEPNRRARTIVATPFQRCDAFDEPNRLGSIVRARVTNCRPTQTSPDCDLHPRVELRERSEGLIASLGPVFSTPLLTVHWWSQGLDSTLCSLVPLLYHMAALIGAWCLIRSEQLPDGFLTSLVSTRDQLDRGVLSCVKPSAKSRRIRSAPF
jgi:hypothetical protein